MSAAFQPRAVKGSRTAVTLGSARKASVVRARLRWKPVVRKRGQAGVCHRMLETMRSTATVLRRMSVTTPAPRVAYQRIVSLMPDQFPSPLAGAGLGGGCSYRGRAPVRGCGWSCRYALDLTAGTVPRDTSLVHS